MKIIIKFIKNKITITGLTKDEELEVELLWTKVRDDYLDWVSEVRVKEFYKGKNIVKYFKWRNMSTWWFNRLVQKDSFVSNKWINRLMVMYLLKNYRETYPLMHHGLMKCVIHLLDDRIVKLNRLFVREY